MKWNHGHIYLIGGVPRAGKTTTGRQLAQLLRAPHLELDVFYDWLRAVLTGGSMALRSFTSISVRSTGIVRASPSGTSTRYTEAMYEFESDIILTGLLGAVGHTLRDSPIVIVDGSPVDISWVTALEDRGWSVSCVFLGYTDVDIVRRLVDEALVGSNWVTEWIERVGTGVDVVSSFFRQQVDASVQLKQRCSVAGLPFVDRARTEGIEAHVSAALEALRGA